MNLFRFTKKLIAIPSPSGKEKEIGDFLSVFFKFHDLPFEKQKIDDSRCNLWIMPEKNYKVLLCTHLDTVSPFIPPSEDQRYIYGRGACDAKGILAAMVQASLELKKEGHTGFGLLLVAGEEADSAGAQQAASSGRTSRYIVVGEPTQNRMGKNHLGYLALKLRAGGKAAHSAFPRLGDSAVEKLLDALIQMRSLVSSQGKDQGFFMNIARMRGGSEPNIIPDHAESLVSFRTRLSSQTLLKKIQKVLPPEIKTTVLNCSEPQKLTTLPFFDQTTLPYGTDIPYLKNFGRPLLFGPGEEEDAHTEKEKIDKKELSDSVSHYKKIVKHLLSEEDKSFNT